MTPATLSYLQNLPPRSTIIIAQAKDPAASLEAIKEYIDEYGNMQFNDDYSIATKLHPIPTIPCHVVAKTSACKTDCNKKL
jgi:hypothetical protein